MHWNSLSDFLAMGGYATYVWGSVGATALMMTLEPIVLVRGRNNLVERLKRQFRAERSDQGKSRSKD